MSPRLSTRLMSFALAALVTGSLLNGIATLALARHANAMQMSQTPAASQVATGTPAPRS